MAREGGLHGKKVLRGGKEALLSTGKHSTSERKKGGIPKDLQEKSLKWKKKVASRDGGAFTCARKPQQS